MNIEEQKSELLNQIMKLRKDMDDWYFRMDDAQIEIHRIQEELVDKYDKLVPLLLKYENG